VLKLKLHMIVSGVKSQQSRNLEVHHASISFDLPSIDLTILLECSVCLLEVSASILS